ncbi:MAG: DUF1611 domain-containing protein [Deltaproteobacteria bacterium]|nr:MAG: DUF1611 domain-containing protein [Deltaproteobacteria bacterium]
MTIKAQTSLEGRAIVYCEGAFGTPNGKTAHGLVRFSRRYEILSVLDSRHTGKMAHEILAGVERQIPIQGNLEQALQAAKEAGTPATHVVVGLAPDGGRLPGAARATLQNAIRQGLHIDSGLHDFLTEDPEFAALAEKHNVTLRDVRKPPHRSQLHFFEGKIEEVSCLKVALLGTDSAVGKRTTAWLLVQALEKAGYKAELIGTGQTAWMQGAQYSIVLDSLINDFVAGELEHAAWTAWKEKKPDVLVMEGQGSLMNPAYPGGFEILAATRPDVVILQHAPARETYDGFPQHPMHPLSEQIAVMESLSSKPVVAVTINHEELPHEHIGTLCKTIESTVGRPTLDVILQGPERLVDILQNWLPAQHS